MRSRRQRPKPTDMDEQANIDRQVVDGSTRMPQAGEHDEAEWGAVGGVITALTLEQQRRLTEEGRDAGFDLNEADGMPTRCAVSLDNLGEAWKAMLVEHHTTLDDARMADVCEALDAAVGC